MGPGMMPTLHFSPGEMMPGQLGPMRRVGRPFRYSATFTMSSVGTPSVMHTTRGMPDSPHHLRPVVAASHGMEGAVLAHALHEHARRAADEDGHSGPPRRRRHHPL